jgi:hypothetical protein
MRLRHALASALVLVWWVVVATAAGQDAPPQPTFTYEQFAALTPQQRYEQFRLLTDANKAVLVREHVNRWLTENRSRLSTSQVATVEEVGSLLFERFENPAVVQTPEFNKRVDALGLQGMGGGKVHCSLRHSDLWAVLGPMVPPLPKEWGWRDEMWAWLEHCVAPRVFR